MSTPESDSAKDADVEKSDSGKGAEVKKKDRSRALPIAIIALATVIGLASVFGLWVKRQALETETFANTSEELIADEDIRNSVADFIVAAIYDNVDVESEVANRLPPQFQIFAAPATAGLRQLTTEVTRDLLARPKVQELWRDVTAKAQEKLIALLDDKGEFVSTTGGDVTLDVTKLVTAVTDEIGIGENLVSKLPPGASEIEIVKSDELAAAQSGMKVLRTLAWVLTVLTLLLYALAIALARGRRRETLRAVGYSFAFIGLLVLFARTAAGNAVTESLASTASIEPAVNSTWEISTSLLQETAQSLVAYGFVIVLAAWLAGPTSIATKIRRAISPYLRQPLVAVASVVAIVALLFWWDPVIATHRLAPSLLLIALLAGGVYALRRQVVREFPEPEAG